MKNACVKIKGHNLESVVVVLSKFGHSAKQENRMKSQACQNQEKVGMMAWRRALKIKSNHHILLDILVKVKADTADVAAMDFEIVDEKMAEFSAECQRKMLEEKVVVSKRR